VGSHDDSGDVKALHGRIGSYRVIFDEDATTVLAL